MALWSKKKYLKFAKGFHGRVKNCANLAISKVERSFQHAYRNRKLRLRNFRTSWIRSIKGGLHEHGIGYNRMINCLNHSNIQLDRKILAELAQYEPYSFKAVMDELKVQGQFVPQPAEHSLLDGYRMGLLLDSPDIRPEDLEDKPKPIDLRLDMQLALLSAKNPKDL